MSEQLECVVADVIDAHAYLHERRGQKLVYLLDLYTYITTGERATDASFYPYRYGPFPPEVESCFDKLSDSGWNIEMDYLTGKTVEKYIANNSVEDRPVDIEQSEYVEEIELIAEATEGWKNRELGNYLKQTRHYQMGRFNRSMKFSRLDPILEDVRSNLFDAFPVLEPDD